MIGFLLILLVVGAIAGFLARAIVPGRDAMGVLPTIVLGIVGSFLGGFLASLIFHGDLALRTTGIIGSIVGAIIALLAYRAVGGRSSSRSRTRV